MAKTKLPMKWIAIGIVALVVIVLVFGFIGMYNGFVIKEQNYMAKWSEVESQYQRQADLIPNLVGILKDYQQFETDVLTDITKLRSQWQESTSLVEKDTVGQEMTGSLGRLIATFEAYPELKTIEAVNNMMDELAGTQNRITVARGRFIESVQIFNTGIKVFPANVFAGMFGFEAAEYFEATEGIDSSVDLDL